jgi:hypothetical protein
MTTFFLFLFVLFPITIVFLFLLYHVPIVFFDHPDMVLVQMVKKGLAHETVIQAHTILTLEAESVDMLYEVSHSSAGKTS